MALVSRILPGHLHTTGLACLLASTLYGTVWSWLGAEAALLIFIAGLFNSVCKNC